MKHFLSLVLSFFKPKTINVSRRRILTSALRTSFSYLPRLLFVFVN